VAPEIMLKNIKISDRVRITWPPFMGTIGKVIALDNQATKLESGIITYLLTIETSSKKIKVPYTNIELITK
jgi:transcription antitermination factor NusG